MTDKRKRLLESFLQNILSSETLSSDSVFALFLKDSLEWSEESLKLLDLQDKTILLPVTTVEQAAKKYDDIIDTRLIEHERAFKDLHVAISALEESERHRLKRTIQLYEALCELGCSLNAFSIEYTEPNDGQQLPKQLATLGESFDADAANLQKSIDKLEGHCDHLHEQRLFCEEANRLILFIAASAVRCDASVKMCAAKRNQLITQNNNNNNNNNTIMSDNKQQLEDIEDEKRVAENDYQRVFNYGQEELLRLRRSMQCRLQEMVAEGSMDGYHSECHSLYKKQQ